MRDERSVAKAVRIEGNSFIIMLLAEVPSGSVASQKKVFVIWWNSKGIVNK
jgi:hypothetical protein